MPFARIGDTTRERLSASLDYGLEPINPVDAWGTGHEYEKVFGDCMAALLDDQDTAVGALCVETRNDRELHHGYARAMRKAHAGSDKPVLFINNLAAFGDDQLAVDVTRAGIPVLIGLDAGLAAIRGAMERRQFRSRPAATPPAAPVGMREKWRPRLAEGSALDEAESLALLADYGVPVVPHRIVGSAEEAEAAASALGFPVALKTAMAGILHKSDRGGVKLGLADKAQVRGAYEDLARRLGARALVAAMASPTLELAFGAKRDPQFGPVVMVGAGGVLIEYLRDRQCALAPFDTAEARRLIDGLALRPLLAGKRGRPPADIAALAEALARFSMLVADLDGLLGEVDVNPVASGPAGPIALDALVIPPER